MLLIYKNWLNIFNQTICKKTKICIQLSFNCHITSFTIIYTRHWNLPPWFISSYFKFQSHVIKCLFVNHFFNAHNFPILSFKEKKKPNLIELVKISNTYPTLVWIPWLIFRGYSYRGGYESKVCSFNIKFLIL
jgi:hypothetical protein